MASTWEGQCLKIVAGTTNDCSVADHDGHSQLDRNGGVATNITITGDQPMIMGGPGWGGGWRRILSDPGQGQGWRRIVASGGPWPTQDGDVTNNGLWLTWNKDKVTLLKTDEGNEDDLLWWDRQRRVNINTILTRPSNPPTQERFCKCSYDVVREQVEMRMLLIVWPLICSADYDQYNPCQYSPMTI